MTKLQAPHANEPAHFRFKDILFYYINWMIIITGIIISKWDHRSMITINKLCFLNVKNEIDSVFLNIQSKRIINFMLIEKLFKPFRWLKLLLVFILIWRIICQIHIFTKLCLFITFKYSICSKSYYPSNKLYLQNYKTIR